MNFIENLDNKSRVFSARAPLLKLVYIGAEDAFRKILRSVIQHPKMNTSK